MQKFMVMFQKLVGEQYGFSLSDPFLGSLEDAKKVCESTEFPPGATIRTLYVFDRESNTWFPVW